MDSKAVASITLSLCLLLIPFAIAAERALPNQWTQRLLNPEYKEEIDRHTPLHQNGTLVPETISADTTLSAKQNPFILTGLTTIENNAVVTIEPGTQIFAAEFSGFNVYGQLNINGARENPVIFTTNELHPDNKTWSGIIFNDQSTGNIKHARINFASPAVSCLKQSKVAAANLKVRDALTGAVTENNNCSFKDSSIFARRTGLIQINSQARLTNSTITGNQSNIKSINKNGAP